MMMMRPLLPLLLALALALTHARAAEFDESSRVLELTADNFEALTAPEDTMLVAFTAPWCGHCKRLAPEYAKAADVLAGEDPPVPLGNVDATEHGELARRFGANGYPTLKVLRRGVASDYKGPRDADGIVAYMRKQSGPAARPADDDEALKAGMDRAGGHFWVLGLFSSPSSRLRSAFTLVANRRRDDFSFFRAESAAMRERFGVAEGEDAVVALKDFDDLRTRYEGDGTSADLERFVEENSLPLVGEHTSESAAAYARDGSPLLKLYVPRWQEGSKLARYYRNRLEPAARFHRGKMHVTVVDASRHEAEAGELGVAVTDQMTPMVIEAGGNRYLRAGKLSKQAVLDFVEDWANDRVERHVKSEPEPAGGSDGPVTVVVGKTFERVVMDRERDVFVEFYAPWCGHCKALAPVYEKLGKRFRKHDSVVIAKLDATANDFPRDKFPVSGYPTMFLAPAGGGDPVPYDGGRDLDELEAFVRKHAVKPLKKRRKKKKKGKKKREEL